MTTDSEVPVRVAPGNGREVPGQLDEGAELALLSSSASADGFPRIRTSTADREG